MIRIDSPWHYSIHELNSCTHNLFNPFKPIQDTPWRARQARVRTGMPDEDRKRRRARSKTAAASARGEEQERGRTKRSDVPRAGARATRDPCMSIHVVGGRYAPYSLDPPLREPYIKRGMMAELA